MSKDYRKPSSRREQKAREKLVLGIRGTYAPRPAGRQL